LDQPRRAHLGGWPIRHPYRTNNRAFSTGSPMKEGQSCRRSNLVKPLAVHSSARQP
jgi:hypothetical protein